MAKRYSRAIWPDMPARMLNASIGGKLFVRWGISGRIANKILATAKRRRHGHPASPALFDREREYGRSAGRRGGSAACSLNASNPAACNGMIFVESLTATRCLSSAKGHAAAKPAGPMVGVPGRQVRRSIRFAPAFPPRYWRMNERAGAGLRRAAPHRGHKPRQCSGFDAEGGAFRRCEFRANVRNRMR